MRKNSVVPLFISPGNVDNRFLDSITNSQFHNKDQWTPIGASSARINLARTEATNLFLQSNAEWAWYIDTDMVFDATVLPRLLRTAKEKKAKVVGGLCFVYDKARNTIVANAYKRNEDQEEGQLRYAQAISYPAEAFEVDATGSACLLVHRWALEDVQKKYEHSFYPWYDETYDPLSKLNIGPDLTFCERLKEAGHTIWYEPRAKVGHLRQEIISEREYLQWRALTQSS